MGSTNALYLHRKIDLEVPYKIYKKVSANSGNSVPVCESGIVTIE